MRTIRTTCLVGSLLVALPRAGLFRAGTVSATTGNTATTPVPALYKVPLKVSDLYPGQYSLLPLRAVRNGRESAGTRGLGMGPGHTQTAICLQGSFLPPRRNATSRAPVRALVRGASADPPAATARYWMPFTI